MERDSIFAKLLLVEKDSSIILNSRGINWSTQGRNLTNVSSVVNGSL
jgi:hypothetical protein